MPERDGAQAAQHERRQREASDLIVEEWNACEPTERRQNEDDLLQRQEEGPFRQECTVAKTASKRVSFLSETLPGSVHDKALADHVDIHFSKTATVRSDLGFLGYHPTVKAHLQPKKAEERRTEAGRETAQPQLGPDPRPGGARYRRSEDQSHCQRSVPQHRRWIVRCCHRHCLWIAQSACHTPAGPHLSHPLIFDRSLMQSLLESIIFPSTEINYK